MFQRVHVAADELSFMPTRPLLVMPHHNVAEFLGARPSPLSWLIGVGTGPFPPGGGRTILFGTPVVERPEGGGGTREAVEETATAPGAGKREGCPQAHSRARTRPPRL